MTDTDLNPQVHHSNTVDEVEFPETLYHFGDNDGEGWAELFSLYQFPPYELPGLQPVLRFGLAGSHSQIASPRDHSNLQ